MDLDELVQKSLLAHLEGVGLTPTATPERVRVGIGDLSVWCRIDPFDRDAQIIAIPMWFSLALENGLVIEESIAGIGQSPEHAANAGVHTWMEGIFPVVRALYQPETWEDGPRFQMASCSQETQRAIQWDVFAGPFQFMGPPEQALLDRLEDPPPFTLVLNSVTGYLHEERLHWVKLFLHRLEGRVDGEVRINNDHDRQAYAELSKFRWPKGEGFQNFRQFLVLRPQASSPEDARAEFDRMMAEAQVQQTQRKKWWEFWK